MASLAPTQDERSNHFRDLQRRSAKARSVAAVERRIRELVDSAPPLSEVQRERLALLLHGGAPPGAPATPSERRCSAGTPERRAS
jgi:hypothetical protein